MRNRWLSLSATVCLLVGCKGSNDEPVPPRPPSAVARLAAQACACSSMECVQPLQVELERIIAAEHAGVGETKDNTEARAKLRQCAARLSAPR
jgi:hypothetical protein